MKIAYLVSYGYFSEMYRCLLICCFFANSYCISAQNYNEATLEKSICSGNWQGTIKQLELFFRGYEVSVHDSLNWHTEHFTNLINYYNNSRLSPAIVVSDFPSRDSVWEYWQNWSDLLTNSNWDPKKSFKSKKEATRLAQYNVLMLLSHELGHHLVHRYRKNKGGLNCQEYLADLASMALISSFRKNGYLSKLQSKYLILINEINSSIPLDSRFDNISFNLHNNCDSLRVVYPADSSLMPQYASAYFVRRLYMDSSWGYHSAKEMIEEIYLEKHKSWLELYPSSNLKANLQGRYTNLFEYDDFLQNQRSLARWKGQKSYISEYSGYAFTNEEIAVCWNAYIPADDNCGSAVISVRSLDGLLINNWVVRPGELVDNRVVDIDVWINGKSNDLHMLVHYRYSEKDSLVLYSSNGSSVLISNLLFVTLNQGRYDLVSVTDSEAVILKSDISERGNIQFKEIRIDKSAYKIEESDLFKVDISNAYTTYWEASANEHKEYLVAINGYLISCKNKEINTVAGTGIMGYKLDLKEFSYPRALSNLGGNVLLLDESSELHNVRTTLTVFSFK